MGSTGIGSGCIIGGTNGIGSPTGNFLTIGIGSAIDGSLPIDGGLFGNLITGPRGSDGVNFGGIEIFGSMPILPNLVFKLRNKLITNSAWLRQRKCPSSYT
jgi:hypothetical protein